VASTSLIFRFVPGEVLDVPPALRVVVAIARRLLHARYMRGYQRRRPLSAGRLAYYDAAACMRALVRTAEARSAPAGDAGLNALDASDFGERLGAHFARLTGVTPRLPGRGAR
jgi:hypothetical protein